MTGAELSLVMFAACNALRIAAYVPQIVKLATHPRGTDGFSYATWVLFGAANASTAVYAGGVLGDAALAAVHAISTFCCVLLLALATWRKHHPATEPAFPHSPAVELAQRQRRSTSLPRTVRQGSAMLLGSAAQTPPRPRVSTRAGPRPC